MDYTKVWNTARKMKLGIDFYKKLDELLIKLESEEMQCDIPVVVSSLTAKDKLYLNTLLVNKLLEKEDDGTYKSVNDIGIMDKINDLMEKVNNS